MSNRTELPEVDGCFGHLWIIVDGERRGLPNLSHRMEIARRCNVHDELCEALRKAVQLASIASDWNLDEVEIDREMVDIYDLVAEFRSLLENERGTT